MSKVIVKEKPKWFRQLVIKIKVILDLERQMVIRAKHRIGKAILEERERAKLEYGTITKFMNDLAKEVGNSWQELYACMKFAEKYPNIETFLTGQKITWKEIVHELLYEKREVEVPPKLVTCLACSDEVRQEETKTFRLCAKCISEFQIWLTERT